MTTTTAWSGAYIGRTVAIEVTGVCHQQVIRKSAYTLQVPYASLTATLHSIRRMGGTIAKVTILTPAPPPSPPPALTPPPILTAAPSPAPSVSPISRAKKSGGFGFTPAPRSPATTASKTKTGNTRSTKQKRR